MLNKKLKYSFNITCGVSHQYHIKTDDSPSRNLFNSPIFPAISNYDGLEQNNDSHNILETNLNVSMLLLL